MARRPSRQFLAGRPTGITVHEIWKKKFLHSQSHCVPYTDKSRSTDGLACMWHSKFGCCQRERWGPPKLNGIVPRYIKLHFQNTGPMWAQLRSGHSTRVRRARVIMKKKKAFLGTTPPEYAGRTTGSQPSIFAWECTGTCAH